VGKRTRDMIKELADALEEGIAPSGDFFEKLIDATAGYDRMLAGLYVVLAAGIVFLLFLVEMSPWAGAALMAVSVVFVVGLAHTTMHLAAYSKMLLLAEAIHRGEETVGVEPDEEEATPEAFLRSYALTRRLYSSESHYLFLGLVGMGAALAIEHWPYAWRAFALLAGVIALLALIEFVPPILRTMTRRSGDSSGAEAGG
jgi:hypothetical protein